MVAFHFFQSVNFEIVSSFCTCQVNLELFEISVSTSLHGKITIARIKKNVDSPFRRIFRICLVPNSFNLSTLRLHSHKIVLLIV